MSCKPNDSSPCTSQNVCAAILYILKASTKISRCCHVKASLMFGFHSTNVKNVVQVEVFVVTLKYIGCSDLVNTQNRLSPVSSERDIVPSVVIQVLT